MQDPSDPIAVEAANCVQALVRLAFTLLFRLSVIGRHCICAQGQDQENGPCVYSICTRLSTQQFEQQALCERKVSSLLQFFSADHVDALTGRTWNADCRARLLVYLSSEIAELERFNLVRVCTCARLRCV